MPRLLALVIGVVGFVSPWDAAAKPAKPTKSKPVKLAVVHLEGDPGNKVGHAVGEALDGKQFSVIGPSEVAKTADKLGLQELDSNEMKELQNKLGAAAVLSGKVEKEGKTKTLHLKLFIHGKKASAFSIEFANTKSPAFRTKVHDQVARKIGDAEGDDGDDEAVAKKKKRDADDDAVADKKKDKKKRVADADDEPKKGKKHDDDDDDKKTKKRDDDKKKKKIADTDDDKKSKKKVADADDDKKTKKRGDDDEPKKKKVADADDDKKAKKRGDDDDKKRKSRDDDDQPAKKKVADADDDDGGKRKRKRTDDDELSVRGSSGGAMFPALRVDAGASYGQRHLEFASSGMMAPPAVSTAAPSGRIAGEVYPLALSNPKGTLAGLGFVGEYEKAAGLSIQKAGVDQHHYIIGARYQFAIGTSATVALGVGYERRAYVIDRGAATIDAPDVTYSAARPEAMVRVPLSPSATVFGGGGALLILSAGQIAEGTSYGAASAFGYEATGGLDYKFTDRIGLRVAGELGMINMKFKGTGTLAMQRSVSAASDRMLDLVATLGMTY